jgi:acetylornithine deacetylase/succinyl-diaminopimelate desuccinylase-like protein
MISSQNISAASFILADDAIHAPNERYDIERLRKGIRSWVRILSELR